MTRAAPDASVYKSGDADKVTLRRTASRWCTTTSSRAPTWSRAEPRGREKICNILRIAYDARTQSVWFGGNHGFAWGDANFSGYSWHRNVGLRLRGRDGARAPGHQRGGTRMGPAWCCSPTRTTASPWPPTATCGSAARIRSTRFRYGTNGNNYWQAQAETEGGSYAWNRYDIWPDAVGEPLRPLARSAWTTTSRAWR